MQYTEKVRPQRKAGFFAPKHCLCFSQAAANNVSRDLPMNRTWRSVASNAQDLHLVQRTGSSVTAQSGAGQRTERERDGRVRRERDMERERESRPCTVFLACGELKQEIRLKPALNLQTSANRFAQYHR